MSIHRPIARNFAVSSENKIHSDEVAQRLGFTGALVPGVTVFGHLTWPLTQRWNTRWLGDSSVTTRFLKPAYDGSTLTIEERTATSASSAVECRNDSGTVLATLECRLGSLPPVEPRAMQIANPEAADRIAIDWDSVRIDEPFASYVWTPDEEHNRDYAARLDDTTDVFRQGVLHPHAILSQANRALVRKFIMPAWIHTGSDIRFRRVLRVGDSIEVRSVAIEKWEKKGHQFIKLYVAYLVDGDVATEIYHTAIFRVAGAS